MPNTGITFNETTHTYEDWGLKLIGYYIPMPPVKTQLVDIPGGNGSLDYSEVTGNPVYGNRDGIELVFGLEDVSYTEWFTQYSQFSSSIHGKKVRMVLDDDPSHYYLARISLDGTKTDPVTGSIVMTGVADPFKYDVQSTASPWLWDTFSFVNGIIRELSDIRVSSAYNTITVPGASTGAQPEAIVFTVTQATNLKLIYAGRTYNMQLGRNYFPAVKVSDQDVTLVFSGSGALSIDHRGAYL